MTPASRPRQKDCYVQQKSRKRLAYQCQECSCPMCIVPCFKLYHTKRGPQGYLYVV